VVAPPPGGRHRVVATMDSAPETLTVGDVQAVLDARGPGSVRVRELVWGSRFRVHHRVADAYRRGPALLVGDAAHVHSPAARRRIALRRSELDTAPAADARRERQPA
jgi:2-polyprenyl-6-methoxyphenol hydroxylase-like FAD-dependent oxidoreductase